MVVMCFMVCGLWFVVCDERVCTTAPPHTCTLPRQHMVLDGVWHTSSITRVAVHGSLALRALRVVPMP